MSSPKLSFAILVTGGPLEDTENFVKFGKRYYGLFDMIFVSNDWNMLIYHIPKAIFWEIGLNKEPLLILNLSILI